MIKLLNWIADNFFGTIIFLFILATCIRYALGYDLPPWLIVNAS